MISEEIRFRNPARQVGFAQLYHVATLDPELSDGALRTFLLYLKYAQQKHVCIPGRDRLARERNIGVATLSRHNAELIAAGYITRRRRMNGSSLTIIEDYENIPRLRAIAEREISERIKNETNEPLKNDTANVSKMQRRMSQFCAVEEEQEEEQGDDDGRPAAENLTFPDDGLSKAESDVFWLLAYMGVDMDVARAEASIRRLDDVLAWAWALSQRAGGPGLLLDKVRSGCPPPDLSEYGRIELTRQVLRYRGETLMKIMQREVRAHGLLDEFVDKTGVSVVK
jgi:DNA-binding MarR family transcriptional regulator